MNALCNNEALPKLLRNMEIDLVYIPESPSSALTLREISDEFFIRFPAMMRDHQVVLETLASRYSEKGCHSDDMFIDFVHPEAALMSLLNHYNQYSAQAGHDVGFWGAQRMQQVVQPVCSFHPSCILKLTFRGGGGRWGGCDFCCPEVLLVL